MRSPRPNLPTLLVRPGALKRLLRLLLRGLLTETGAGALREARTEPLPNGRPGLILTGDGAIPANAMDQPFDAEDGPFAAVDPIDRMAMQVLLRETGGALQARNRPEGGVNVRIEWA